MCGRGDFDISDGEAEGGQDFPNGHPCSYRLNTLAGAYASDLLVLEACENVWQECGGPNGVVVSKDNNIGGGVFDSMAHLEPLVGEGDGQNTYTLRVDLVCEVLQGTKHFFFSDNKDFFRLASKPAIGRFLELLSSVDGGYNNSNVLRCDVGGVLRERYWAICERGGYAN